MSAKSDREKRKLVGQAKKDARRELSRRRRADGPAVVEEPSQAKAPKMAPGVMSKAVGRDGHPTWRLTYLDLDHELFGWKKIDADALLQKVLVKIQAFETMTWHEIDQAKKHHHFLTKVSDDLVQRLDDLELGGMQDQLFSFGLENRLRIVGIRVDGVFAPVWFDPAHLVAPSPKKRT